MEEDYHIDLSVRLYEEGSTGIACVSASKKDHCGCVLTSRVKRYIEKNLFIGKERQEYAKLYAICISYIIKDKMSKVRRLIICNDEEFLYVKEYLLALANPSFEVINISEFQNSLGRRVKSLADNMAESYRKRGLKPWRKGKSLNTINISYAMIKEAWEKLR